MKKNLLYREWNQLLKKEIKMIGKMAKDNHVSGYTKLDQYVRDDVQAALTTAFEKGFAMVVVKGGGVIEKTCSRKKHLTDYQIKKYTHDIKQDKKSLRAIGHQATKSTMKNMFISGTEGIGLGVLGVGLPDIPLFVGVIMKSIYEIALDYGCDYKSNHDLHFILKVIQGALESQQDILATNDRIDSMIMKPQSTPPTDSEIMEQVSVTANLLSKELLYAKFVQGLPIVGIVGGVANITCLHKITKYATIKYHKKFLYDTINTDLC